MEQELIEVMVKDVEPDFASGQFRIVLQDNKTGRILTIWVGPFEGHAILQGLEEVRAPRPMTHDLVVSLIGHMHGHIQRVVITEVKDNVFYSVIDLKIAGETVTVDSRPSDAIAVALRLKTPIFVSRGISDNMSDELDDIFERLQPMETVH
jgi:bifunctional DNase/RNase